MITFAACGEVETLEIVSEDKESAFNLFRMLPAWRSFDPNQWVYVAITTVPLE